MRSSPRRGSGVPADGDARGEADDGDGVRRTGHDLLVDLVDEPCPLTNCSGTLMRAAFRGTEAVVCDDCAVPALRLWGDSP